MAIQSVTETQLLGTLKAMRVLASDDRKIVALALWRAITGDDLRTAQRILELVVTSRIALQ